MSVSLTGNRNAFADMLAHSEGTAGLGDDGYNILVGSTPHHPLTFSSYADHPRIYNRKFNSTAAGRYQLIAPNFNYYHKILRLPDFSPACQDAITLQQWREMGALRAIDAGHVELAIDRVKHIWASLPGAGYGQHENKLADLVQVYKGAGGAVAA